MKKNYIFLIVTSLTLLYTGCSKDAMSLFEGYVPSMEKRFDKSMYYNEEHGYPVLKVKDDNYRIYVCTDTHVKDSTTLCVSSFSSITTIRIVRQPCI